MQLSKSFGETNLNYKSIPRKKHFKFFLELAALIQKLDVSQNSLLEHDLNFETKYSIGSILKKRDLTATKFGVLSQQGEHASHFI
jgi:hypothetical protein